MTENHHRPIRFALGSWPSATDPGWQAAADAVIADQEGPGVRLYGVLEGGLSPLPIEDQLSGGRRRRRDEAEAWVGGWVGNALAVVLRYHQRIGIFELLPHANVAALEDAMPRIHPTWFAAALTGLNAGLSRHPRVRVTRVAGALAGGQVGRASAGAYASAVLRAGRTHYGWPKRGLGPVAAWAIHPALDAAWGDAEPDGLGELERFARGMRRRAGAGAQVYVSGLYVPSDWVPDARGAEAQDPQALAQAIRGDPRFVLVEEALPEGPVAPALDAGYAAHHGPADEAARELAPEAPAFEPRAPSPQLTIQSGGVSATAATRDLPPQIPVADGFDPPVGRADRPWVGYRNAAGLADPGYFQDFGAWHPGEDWNGVGGGNTDLGDPVFAIGHGLVKAARWGKGTWGKVVLIEHRLPDGSPVWSQYAHLDQMTVEENQLVARGQQVGTIGRGNPPANATNWFAHLHFEIRKTLQDFDNWFDMVKDKSKVLANYAAGRAFIDANRPGQMPTQPAIVVDNGAAGFQRADVPNWFPSTAGQGGGSLFTFASRTSEANTASWTTALPSPGPYLVSAFVPGRDATTRNAQYTVVHAGGQSVVRVNQNAVSELWVPLGSFEMGAEGIVRLTDRTGEADSARFRVNFDAVRWQPLG